VTPRFSGIDNFKGIHSLGTKNDISMTEMQGKNVVIIGGGETAVQNVHRALQAKAKSVTMIIRSKRLMMPSIAAMELGRIYASNCIDPKNLQGAYKKAFQAAESYWRATGTKEMFGSSMKLLNGSPHLKLKHGLGSFNADALMLAHYHELVNVVYDHIQHIEPNGVKVASGTVFNADVIISCVGYKADTSILDDHILHNSFFVDGCPN